MRFQSLSLPSEKREFSSVGSEHLPYKQRVGGSNPSTPTVTKRFQRKLEAFFGYVGYLFWAEIFEIVMSKNVNDQY